MLVVLLGAPASAQDPSAGAQDAQVELEPKAAQALKADEPLRIGTREAPPFAMQNDSGKWEGISIDLLALVAGKLDAQYSLVETSLEGMIDDVASGKLDASIAAVTMTAERETRVDFSHSYFRTALGAAVAQQRHLGVTALWDALTSTGFLSTVGLLTVLLLVVGALAWFAERRKNPDQFEPKPRRGLFSGFWWAAVTMTTVGYGDKAPVTTAGRLLGIVWMYAALILTAAFTAQLAASLTSTSVVDPAVGRPSDLASMRVGYVADASSLGPLRALGVRPRPYPDVLDGLRAVASKDINAFVHDEPILTWYVPEVDGVVVSGVSFAPQDYAIVLPNNTPYREAVNRAVLEVVGSDEWTAIQRRYLGGE